MARIPQNPQGKGSLKDIQRLVNENRKLIDDKIRSTFSPLSQEEIIWVSPLKTDDFAEYRDNDFIKLLGLETKTVQLENFWPARGPQWDALAKTQHHDIILVEAKANIPEFVSPPSGAGPKSLQRIKNSLDSTKTYLEVTRDQDWSGHFYQYFNRLAHLYFFRVQHGLPAYLINIYFYNDPDVKGPASESEWKAAIQVMKEYFGITKHKLSKYMADIFIDYYDLK